MSQKKRKPPKLVVVKMPIPQALVTRYFQLIIARQFTVAERELEKLKQKMQKTEWNRGYFRALYGMYLSRKTNDTYAFFSKIDLSDKPTVHAFRREFLDHTRNGYTETSTEATSPHGQIACALSVAWTSLGHTAKKLKPKFPKFPRRGLRPSKPTKVRQQSLVSLTARATAMSPDLKRQNKNDFFLFMWSLVQ